MDVGAFLLGQVQGFPVLGVVGVVFGGVGVVLHGFSVAGGGAGVFFVPGLGGGGADACGVGGVGDGVAVVVVDEVGFDALGVGEGHGGVAFLGWVLRPPLETAK